jgi:hypothetical protein
MDATFEKTLNGDFILFVVFELNNINRDNNVGYIAF